MFKKNSKYLPQIIASLFLAIIIFAAGFFYAQTASAALELTGWAWSNMDDPATPEDESTIGWVSFNSRNCDIDGDGIYEGAGETGGPAPTGCPVSGGVSPYRITINETSGKFSGYAWSSSIGWIDFSPASGFPSAPFYSAKVDLVGGAVTGWARALANGGGWSGWIKLSGLNYGVSLNAGAFEGYAWSDMVIGWLSFSSRNCDIDGDGIFEGASEGDPPGSTPAPLGCPTSGVAPPYGVEIPVGPITNNPPDEPSPDPGPGGIYGLDGVSDNNCSYQDLSLPTFHWIYSDSDGDPQAGYEIRINDGGGNEFTCGGLTCSGGGSPAFTPMALDWANWSAFGFNKTFYWQVRVKDTLGAWSPWMNPPVAFSTPVHAFPWPDFIWTPSSPNKGEQVKFTDKTGFDDPLSFGKSWQWNFGDGSPLSSVQNPTHKYLNSGNYSVILQAGDDAGFCASAGKEIRVKSSSGGSGWKEISPF